MKSNQYVNFAEEKTQVNLASGGNIKDKVFIYKNKISIIWKLGIGMIFNKIPYNCIIAALTEKSQNKPKKTIPKNILNS